MFVFGHVAAGGPAVWTQLTTRGVPPEAPVPLLSVPSV
jgi:hypothetical protein